MDSVLVELAQAALESVQAGSKLAESRNLSTQDDKVQIQITIADAQTQAAIAAVQSLGGEISGRSNDGRLLQGWLPPQALPHLAEQKSVAYIRPPAQVIIPENPQSIDVTSQGAAVIQAPAWHAAGLRGSGVKVAIVDAGFTGYTSLLNSELPASVTVRNFVDKQNEWDVSGNSAHGTAAAEVLHDLAPQASLYLAKVNTPIDLEEAIGWLIAQDVDIISTSVGWYNVSPGDGSGIFVEPAQLARQHGIFWVTAAGDSRRRHWGGAFKDQNGNKLHDYDYFSGQLQEVNWFGYHAGDDADIYTLPVGTHIQGFLRWDDWTTVDQDYTLNLVRQRIFPNNDWVTVASSNNPQTGLADQAPTEYISHITQVEGKYGFTFYKNDGVRDVNIEFFQTNSFGYELDQYLPARSLYNLADVPAVFTTSALNVVAPYLQELYSAEGPTNGPGGAATGGVIKPDIASYANVSTVTYGAGGFNGTAAAAAHVAGAAALVKSAAPAYTPDQIQWYLQSQSVDLGAPGKDSLYGSGRLLLGSPAAFQTLPDIAGLPDQLVAQNSSVSQAVDLWAYASDAFTPDEQLVFSIDNTPNPAAGISIAGNRYLSIQPSPNWTGQTQVSVRVTTPYTLSDSDQLEVTVLAPPQISNLPNQVLPVNGSLSPAIDLWAYSMDAYYADAQLSFSLENVPDPHAGLSISENRYLHINPLTDWTGQIQVSVRVTSPIGLADTDAFNLHVLAPPVIADLPDQYVPTNVSLYQVIDLWAYTFDPYISDDQISFRIDNSPAVKAGVSISQNRYIDIQPAAGWRGQTQVVVRAETPYAQSDTAEFNVTVGRYKIWNGGFSRSWYEPTNWTPQGVPEIEHSVIIPYTTNQPQLSASTAVNDLIIEANAGLDLADFVLSVEGEVVNHGSLQQTRPVAAGETSRFLHLTNQAGDQDKYFGVDWVTAAQDPLLGFHQSEPIAVTVVVLGDQFCPMRFSGVRRCYTIQPSQLLSANLSFYFSENEANGLAPETLVTYRLDQDWNEEIASYTGGNNHLGYFLSAPDRSSFGTFSLDQSGNPTYACMLPLVMNDFIPLDSSRDPLEQLSPQPEVGETSGFVQLFMQAWLTIKEAILG
jgi:hypothetical protein